LKTPSIVHRCLLQKRVLLFHTSTGQILQNSSDRSVAHPSRSNIAYVESFLKLRFSCVKHFADGREAKLGKFAFLPI
jgi:hypothetical protein